MSDHPKSSGNFILHLVLSIVLLSALCVSFILWEIMSNFREAEKTERLQDKLLTLSEKMAFYDESLTSSARMRAMTGDTLWKNKYDHFKEDLSGNINYTN